MRYWAPNVKGSGTSGHPYCGMAQMLGVAEIKWKKTINYGALLAGVEGQGSGSG